MAYRALGLLVCLGLVAADAAPLAGRLTAVDGRPGAGATVWLLTRSADGGWAARSTVTASDGGFAFAVDAGGPGRLALVARVAGQGVAVWTADTPAGGVDLRLAPGDTLEGQALDARRQPLAAAKVTLTGLHQPGSAITLPAAAAESLWCAYSGADGTWRLSDVPVGSSRRVAVRGQRTAWSEAWVGPGVQYAPACITVSADGAMLGGRVLHADGQPAAGLRLRAAGEETHTGADGTFAFQHVPRDGTVEVIVPGPESDHTGLRLWRGNAESAGRLALRLPKQGRLRGRVMGRDGQPEAARPVGLQGADRWYQSTETGADGWYEFATWPGEYTVAVYGVSAPPPAKVTAAAGVTTTVPTLTVPRARHRVVVRDDQGRPMASTTLWVGAHYGTASRQATDAQGALVVDTTFIRAPSSILVYGSDPWAVGVGSLGAEPKPLTVTLKRLAAMVKATGDRVVDDRGEPVRGARLVIDLVPTGTAVAMFLPRCLEVITDQRGAWRLPALPVGQQFSARVDSPGYRRSEAVHMAVTGRTVTIQVTSLQAQVSGRVVDAAGQPVAGALVYAEGHLGAQPALSDSAGRFVCHGLPRAGLTITALRGRREVGRAPCQSPADGLTVRIAELPSSPWPVLPSDDDVDLAHAIILDALAATDALPTDWPAFAPPAGTRTASHGQWLALLARIEPGEALEQMALRERPATASLLPSLLKATPVGVVYDEQLLRFVQRVRSDAERRQAARWASDHLPIGRRDLHEQLLRLAAGAAETNRRPLVVLEQAEALATLTLRAGRPATDELRAFAQAYAKCPSDAGGGPAWLAQSAVRPTLLDALTPQLRDPDALTNARCASLLRVLAADRDGALTTARRWWPGADGQTNWPRPKDLHDRLPRRLRVAVARRLVDEQPEQARRLLGGLAFGEVLECAMVASDEPTARALLGVAAERQALDRQSTRARLALCAPLDAGLAERCRQDLLGSWATSPGQADESTSTALALLDGSVNVAYGLGLIDPNRTRWVAESAYSLAPAGYGQRAQAALAMAPADVQRARAMAASEGPAGGAMRALAEWLLADRGERVAFDAHARQVW